MPRTVSSTSFTAIARPVSKTSSDPDNCFKPVWTRTRPAGAIVAHYHGAMFGPIPFGHPRCTPVAIYAALSAAIIVALLIIVSESTASPKSPTVEPATPRSAAVLSKARERQKSREPGIQAWRYSGRPEQRDRIEKAITSATQSMAGIDQAIARRRLMFQLVPKVGDRIQYSIDDGHINLQLAGCTDIEGVPLEATSAWDCGGVELRVSHQLRGDVLVQHAHGHEMQLSRVFSVHGDELHLQVEFHHTQISDPIRFSANYERTFQD